MSDGPNNPYVQGNPYGQGGAWAGGPAKYCTVCGAGLVAQAVICPTCGSPTGLALGGKSKTAAVLLAVFLGPWTWLYTYRRNAWKFWVGLGAGVVGVVLAIVLGFVLAVSTSSCANQFYGSYGCYQTTSALPAVGIFFVVLFYVVWFAVWVWSIVDVSVAPPRFYQSYPNG